METYTCPCCRLPTLDERGAWDVCLVCWWEDDGQDDPRADEVWDGPNHGYSLSAARRNFLDHGHMFERGQGIEVVERPSPARLELLAYIDGVQRREHALDRQKFDDLIAQLYGHATDSLQG